MKSKLFTAMPHVVAILTFILLSSAFFNPAYDGYDLRQGDIAQFLGMSKEIRDYREFYDEETLWTNSMFAGMPAYQISLIQSRNVPKMIFSFVRDLFPGPVGTLFLAMLSFYILGLCLRVNPWLAMIGAIGFGFSTIHILYLGAGHASKVNAIALMPGVVGGVILAYRGKMLLGAGIASLFLAMHLAANHLQMTYYLLFLVAFIGVSEVLRLVLKHDPARAIKTSGLLLVGAALALLPNMTNILSTYSYSEYTTRGETELTILPEGKSPENVSADGLDRDYILEYSMSRGEFWSMMIPNIKGGAAGAIGNNPELLSQVDRNYRDQVAQSNTYWGAQRFTGGAFYFGALIMALFILSFFVLRKETLRWPFLILTLICILLSWKDASLLTDIFLENVPLFSKFRDTKMILVLVSIMAPILGMLAIQRILDGIHPESRKWFYIGSGVALLPLLLFLIAPGVFFDFISPMETTQFESFIMQNGGDFQAEGMIEDLKNQLTTVRQTVLRADTLRSFMIVLAGLVLLLLLDRKIIKPTIAFAGLALIITVDGYSVNRRYINAEKRGQEMVHWQASIDRSYPHQPGQADQFILTNELQQDPSLGTKMKEAVETRMDNLEEDALEGLKRKERELAIAKVQASAQFGMLNLNTHYRVLNLNNPFSDARTSYFHKSLGGYHGAKLKRYQELIDFHLSPELQRFVETANSVGPDAALRGMEVTNMLNARYVIYDLNGQPIPNTFANGNAWFVGDIEFVASADEEMEELYTLRTKQTAVVHENFKDVAPTAIVPDSTASITLSSYLPDQLIYSTSSAKDQFAVFSEIWYPEGWLAFIDGKEVPIVRANYALRALPIPAGDHEVEFVFDPQVYQSGQTLSMVGSILILLFAGGMLFLGFKRERSTELTA